MVNVKDLMLGNLVKVFDPEYKDVTLDYWDIYEIREEGVRLGLFSDIFESEWLEGIEVTKEILKKIGFKKDTTAGEPWEFWRYWDKDGKYKLDVYPEELYCNSERKFGLHVDNDVCNTIGSGEFTYLHELQNLVRCITGHSLPITKEMLQ